MQTWTAMQIPTSKLQKRHIIQKTYQYILNVNQRELPQADVVIERKLDSIDNLWDLRHHSQNCHPDKILQKPNMNVSAVPGSDKVKARWARSESSADLWDIGLVEYRLNVHCDQISTGRCEDSGHDEDDQGPPPWPVDHRSVASCNCRKREALKDHSNMTLRGRWLWFRSRRNMPCSSPTWMS